VVKAIAVVMAFGLAVSAQAVLIDGDVAFTGAYTLDNPDLLQATEFASFSGVLVADGQAFGDYAGTDDGVTPVTFTPFSFSPAEATPFLLWTFTIAATTYSFDASTLNVSYQSANTLVIEGLGTASITGFDATPGLWNITANKAGAAFSFSSSASVGVPDGGMTLSLLGLALGGIAALRRVIGA
jgi:hypothetical protein